MIISFKVRKIIMSSPNTSYKSSGQDFEWKNVKILHKEKNHRKRSIAEMFFIKKQKDKSLNKMTDLKFFPLSYGSLIDKI